MFALNRELLKTDDTRDISFEIRRGRATRSAKVRLVPEGNHFMPDLITSMARMLAAKKPGETVRLTLILPGAFRREEVQLKVR